MTGRWTIVGRDETGHVRFGRETMHGAGGHFATAEGGVRIGALTEYRADRERHAGPTSNVPTEKLWPEHELASEYAAVIGDFIADALWQSTTDLSQAMTSRSVVRLQGRVDQLEELLSSVLERMGDVKPAVRPIPWPEVCTAVSDSANALGWPAEIKVHAEEDRVEIRLPADLEDVMIEKNLQFYASIASRVGSDVASRVWFDLDVFDES